MKQSRSGGFTLAELLVVLAIIMVVAGLSVPAMKGITEGSSLQIALGKITGSLEAARTYAVAHNTHTWVAFTDNAKTGNSEVRLVGLASATGADINPRDLAEKFHYPDQDAQVRMILPVDVVRNVRLDGEIPAANAMRNNPEILPDVSDLKRMPGSATELSGSSFVVGNNPEFGRAIHFLPTGEAQRKSGPPEAIQIVVIPERSPGVVSDQDDRKAAVIRVSGLTGQAMVYTPR